MRSLLSLLAASALLAACGSSSRTTADAPPGQPDTPTGCTPSSTSITLMVPRIDLGNGSSEYGSWRPDSVAGPHAFIGHARGEADALQVARIDSDATVLADLPAAAPYRFSAVAVPGTECALVSSGKTGLGYGCPGQSLDAASIIDVGGPMFAVPGPSSLFVYTQTFASFTLIERSGPGHWTEHEQFESSVSVPTDAVLAGGEPFACFLNSGDRPVIAHGDARFGASAAAKWCLLAVDGTTLRVLTDVGSGSIGLADPEGPLALAPLAAPFAIKPQRLVMVGGAPHALVRSTVDVQLVPLAGGSAIVFPPPQGTAVVDWDATTQSLIEISTTTDVSGPGPLYPQTITYQTYCL